MTYLKAVFIGSGTVLLGVPISFLIWAMWKSKSGAATVSYSPMGLTNHLAHSPGFWCLVIALFTAAGRGNRASPIG